MSWGGDARHMLEEGEPLSFPSPGCSESARSQLSSAGLSKIRGLGAVPPLRCSLGTEHFGQALPGWRGEGEQSRSVTLLPSGAAWHKRHRGSWDGGHQERDGGTAGVSSAALVLRALETQWPGWGRC